MKLTKSNKLGFLLTCMLAFLLCVCALFGINAYSASAEAEENTAGLTTVPDDKLVQLSDDSDVMFYANNTGYPVIRYTATGSYTLKDVTDIAIRIKNAERQVNKPNTNGGLCYIQFKFKNDDTIWNLKNENYILASDGTTKLYTHYTMLRASGTISKMVGTAKGGTAAKGGMLAVTSGMDGTLYIPLTMIYKDGGLTEADRITAVEGYEDLELEYIEFEYSSWRWDIVVGDVATIAKSEDTYTANVMSFDKAAQNEVGKIVTDIYDDVNIVLNGVEGTVAKGKATASVEGIGSVSVADELRFFTKASVVSDLAEGYGITNVVTKVYKADGTLIDSVTANPLSTGYVFSDSYGFRINKPENTDDIGLDPVKCVIEVTVAPLVKVHVTGESAGVTVAYGKLDTSAGDDLIYLANGSDSEISITPLSGFDFTEVKLNGETLTNTATEEGAYTYIAKVTEESNLEIVGVGDPVDITVEKAEGTKAAVAIGDKTFAEASETYATNLRKTLSLAVTPEAGYAAKVEKVVPAAEKGGEATVTELTADENGAYKFTVDGAFTIRVTTSIISYTVTYRLNNGVYAEGESNPETITVTDVVTLKNPTREGYEFLGWKIQGGEDYVTELKEISSDITVVANWKRKVVVDDDSSTPGVDDDNDSSAPGVDDNENNSDSNGDVTSSVENDGSSQEDDFLGDFFSMIEENVLSGCSSAIGGGIAAIAALCAAACLLKKKKD